MQIVIIDNYDSFTYNLVQAFESLGAGVTVWRNDAFSLADLRRFDRVKLYASEWKNFVEITDIYEDRPRRASCSMSFGNMRP